MAEKKLTDTKEQYKNTCFVIMPISDPNGYDEGHFQNIYEQVFIPAIEAAGYTPYRVDDNRISDSIIINIIDAIQYAPMALCDLSSNNPNVMYELGLRQAYDKPVVLVKDDETKRVFDIGGINTVEYKKHRLYENIVSAKNAIQQAIEETKNSKAKYSLISMLRATQAPIKDDSISNDEVTKIMMSRVLSEMENLNRKVDQISRPRFVPNGGVKRTDTDISDSSAEILKAAANQIMTDYGDSIHFMPTPHFRPTSKKNIKKDE